MVLRRREVVKGEKVEIKKTEDYPALVEVEISTSIASTLSAFCPKAINLGHIAIKQDFIPPNFQNRSLQVFNADWAFHWAIFSSALLSQTHG